MPVDETHLFLRQLANSQWFVLSLCIIFMVVYRIGYRACKEGSIWRAIFESENVTAIGFSMVLLGEAVRSGSVWYYLTYRQEQGWIEEYTISTVGVIIGMTGTLMLCYSLVPKKRRFKAFWIVSSLMLMTLVMQAVV